MARCHLTVPVSEVLPLVPFSGPTPASMNRSRGLGTEASLRGSAG